MATPRRRSRAWKSAEDDRFQFRFSFIDTGRDKAFVHACTYRSRPKSEASSDISDCRSSGTARSSTSSSLFLSDRAVVPREQDMWGENVSRAHGAFDAHASQFSPGVESLLAANAAMETVGMSFLRLDGPTERMKADIATKVIRLEMTFHAGGLAGEFLGPVKCK
jgi:hypothetical protein